MRDLKKTANHAAWERWRLAGAPTLHGKTPWHGRQAGAYWLMKMAKAALVAGTIFSVGVTGAFSESPKGRSQNIQSAELRALLGKTVENQDGERLGKVVDFVADFRSGYVNFGVISTGGILGIKARLKLVPVTLLTAGTAKRGVVAADVRRDAWANSQHFSRHELQQLAEPSRVRDIYKAYGATQPNGTGPATRLVATGRGASHEPGFAPIQFVTELTGRIVMDGKGREVGRVTDFLADLSGHRPTFVLVTRSKRLKHGETFAVPITMLQSGAGRRLILAAPEHPLETAPRFSPQAWDEGRIYRYTGS